MDVPLHQILALRHLLTSEERAARSLPATGCAAFRDVGVAPYLLPGTRIDVAAGTAASEPLVFATPFSGRPDGLPEGRRQPIVHPKGFVEVTGLRVTFPGGEPISGVMRPLQGAGVLSFETGDEHLAEIEFDLGSRDQSVDFRPALPLRFRW